MGLTNENPRATINAIQVMAEIATAVKLFEEYGLDQLVKDAYALPDAEQAKVDKARADFSANQTLLSDIKKAQSNLDNTQIELDAQQDDLNKKLKAVGDGNTANENRKRELEKQGGDLKQREADLRRGQDDLLGGINKLASDNADLDKRRREVDAYELSLKDKAAQLQALTKGI